MSEAHYEAVRISSERPYSMNGSRKSFLPSRMRRTPTTPDIRTAHRFSQPNPEVKQQLTHEHILVMGDNILAQMQRKNELRMQQTYKQMLETERKRMENEYEQRSNEMARKWKAQFEEEKYRLQKDFDQAFGNMEHTRRERSRDDEEAIIRQMKDECDQALAKQWKIANEQLTLAVQQAEDRLRSALEFSYLEEKERFSQELTAKKETEYAQRETRALEKLKDELTSEHRQQIQRINDRHAHEIAALTKKLKLTEERFRREFSTRARLESDFRLLQMDYKRFMDHSNFFHSDYMLKLCHIGEQIGDAKFEQVLDRILAESDIPSKPPQNSTFKSKHSSKTRPT